MQPGVNGKAAAIVGKAQVMPTHAPSAETEEQQRQHVKASGALAYFESVKLGGTL